MAKMSKEMPIEVFAKKVGIDKKEQEWIVKNDKDTHYHNNTPLKGWLSLSYPVYDGDYYFAFIHKNPRVNAQYNAKANRELRKYIKSSLNADQIFDEMEDYFAMQFKNAGSGDTMTREELWSAIVDARKKNPVREGLGEGVNVLTTYRQMWEDGQKYAPQLDEQVSDITVDPRNKISKSADQNKHAMEIAKQAKRFGLKSSMMGKHVRVKGNKKAVNDFLRIIIGKSSYGDPTEKDMSTPQIDKMLTKGLK